MLKISRKRNVDIKIFKEAFIGRENEKNWFRKVSYIKDKNWKNKLPALLGISTWVGYDLDGRSDINWRTSFILRLKEIRFIVGGYKIEHY